jgi:hypothetical protein
MFTSFLGLSGGAVMVRCGANSERPAATIFRFKVIWFIIISGYVGNNERWSLVRFNAKWEDKNMDL